MARFRGSDCSFLIIAESQSFFQKSFKSQLAKLATDSTFCCLAAHFYPTFGTHAIHIFGQVIHRNSKRQICMHFNCIGSGVNK